MGKKVTDVLLFLAVFAAAIGMTIFVGQGEIGVMIYNFGFLGVMTAMYLAAILAGMFRMNGLAEGFRQGTEKLTGIFKAPGKTDIKNLSFLKELFDNHYLDKKMDNFTGSIHNSEEGICEIEEYINEEEIDIYIHKRLLELVPDIFTSLGILGTFVGLVWGLKNFEPTNYEAMTTSVSMLVDGIKVAFLTSIYGISYSIIYNICMKSEYSSMTENLQAFLEKFHAYVIPTAENESRNLLVASQKLQTQAMKQMAEQFSVQMADSFEKVITPTFQKMNDSLDHMVTSVIRCQEDAVREILQVFLTEMNRSFQTEFKDFNQILADTKQAMKENTAYASTLYQTMGQQLNDSFLKQEKTMRDMVTELGGIQSDYMKAASQITQENQKIQKMQQEDYQHIVEYMKDSERSAAKFWVACNQAMQKYVETAAGTMDKASASGQASTELIQANAKLVEDFGKKLQEFGEYQRLSYRTMEQVRRLLSEITAAGGKDVYLMNAGNGSGADKDALRQVQNILKEQGERQEALLEEIASGMKTLSKAAQKGKFKLF